MKPIPPELAALAGKRVLICEDEGITILQLSRAVTHAGLVPAGVASTVPDAIESALRDRPEIIFLDVRLSGGNGIQAIREIAGQYAACIIALVTSVEDARAAEEAGASAFAVKPADSAELLRTLPACFERFSHAVVTEMESASERTPPVS